MVAHDVPLFCHAVNDLRCGFYHVADHEECSRGIVLFQHIQNGFGISVFIAAVKGEIDDFSGIVANVIRAILRQFLSCGVANRCLPFCLERGFSVDHYGYIMSVYTAASLLCVVVLGIVKLRPKARFWTLALGFSSSVIFFCLAFSSTTFLSLCIWTILAAIANCAGNTIFSASLMLMLPEENRGAILGFIQSASVGGSALSAVIYGVLGDIFPLYLVFIAGNAISLIPMMYMAFHPRTKTFIIEH